MRGKRTKADATADLVRLGIRPRMLEAGLAAAYYRLSVGAFLKGVAEDRYPQPLGNGKRKLWDIRALDAAIDRRSGFISSQGSDNSADAIMRAIDEA